MNDPLLMTDRRPAMASPVLCDETLAAPDPVEGVAALIDRSIGAMWAQWTLGIAPDALGVAFADWWLHLATSPGRQLLLMVKAGRKWQRLADYAVRATTHGGEGQRCIQPLPQDRRFVSAEWDTLPFGLYQQGFLLGQQWLDAAVRDHDGVTPHHDAVVRFVMRQIVDMFSPSNFIFTNPVVQKRLFETGGMSLSRGLQLLADDWQRLVRRQPPIGTESYAVGRELAKTSGKVVFRNDLIELLQFSPSTETVRPEPVLIVPAWIMKYYILDLSPENSLVRSLVAAGFTVFVISWRNPGAEMRDTGMEDYQSDGVMAALAAVTAITGAARVHACGYCLGGTLLAIVAATLAREADKRLATLTFLAAQVDFAEPGEIGLFVDDSQVRFLENLMWQQGYLDSRQMGGAFEMLRSADLIWSRGVQTYLLGERPQMTDLMAWNADGTRMPFAMHSQYLRRLFLQNDLAEGRYKVGDRPVSLSEIESPCYILSAERDHVAPWHSVWKLLDLTKTEARFVLASGGHNGGIVAPPGRAGRHYRHLDRAVGARHLDSHAWFETTEPTAGSWWNDWFDWLVSHSGAPGPAPPQGRSDVGYPVLGDAPGRYVLQH